MSIISDVKEKTDIVEIISQYTALTKAGRTFRGLCPFHNEKHGSFFVYPEQQSWHCFGACATGGDVFAFLMKKEGIDFGEALKRLADRARIVIPAKHDAGPGRDLKDRLYAANEAAAGYFHELLDTRAGEKAKTYLDRRFKAESIARFRLGYSPDSWENLKKHLLGKGFKEEELLGAGLLIKAEDGTTHDRFRNRVMFPIHDVRGRTAGFGGRVLDDAVMPKYLNSPQTAVFDKGGTLYGIDFAVEAIREKDFIVIVEGYADVIVPHEYGFKNVVASMGTAITENHVNIFKKYTRNMVLALDSDTAGQEAMKRGIDYENMLDSEVKVAIMPEGKDPDEVVRDSPEIFEKLIKGSMPVTDFIFNQIASGLDLNDEKNKKQLVEQLLPLVARVKTNFKRDRFLNYISAKAGVNYKTLEQALVRSIPERKNAESQSEAIDRAVRSFVSNPVEEYCLALLLRHPEIHVMAAELSADLFDNTENRVIFTAWQQTREIEKLRESLDESVRERLEYLNTKMLVESRIEEKFTDLERRLREKYYRDLERKKGLVLSTAAESGGTEAELASLAEQGIDTSTQLGRIFKGRGKRLKGR